MKTVFVIAKNGKKLMPTNIKHARKLLKRKEAIIFKHEPFTIKLTRPSKTYTQNIEFTEDTGSIHIGISLKSEKHEFVDAQYDNLLDEAQRRHNKVSYRRNRRKKLRYRKARWQNRKIEEGWIAPSIKNKKQNHIRIFEKYYNVCPITNIILEIGNFDIQSLSVGRKLQGKEYQKGKRNQISNLREAVFYRDNYTCQCCGKSIKDGAILRVHHNIHRDKGGSNSIDNLVTICTHCHTAANHKKGKKLESGVFKKIKSFKDASFMNIIKWNLLEEFKNKFSELQIDYTYGAYTKVNRKEMNLEKSHANDAYCIGEFRPKDRSQFQSFKKRRRNNRILETFKDAKYVDIRDGEVKKGSELSCGRTNRSESRNSDKNERIHRGQKIRKGFRSIRRNHYKIGSGDIVEFEGNKYRVIACISNGKSLNLEGTKKYPNPNKVKILRKGGSYVHYYVKPKM